MRFNIASLCIIAAIGCACLVASSLRAAQPAVETDNKRPPYLAVWKEPKYQPQGFNEFNHWLNRTNVWADISPCIFYQPATSWSEVELPFDKFWGDWATRKPECRTILTPPMLPYDKSSTLAIAATGAYNSHFAALAKNLVDNHLGNTILCMGPCSDWGVPWKISNKADAKNFTLFWKQIVTAMRAVPGAEKLKFDWVAPGGRIAAAVDEVYPGDDCVDYIGLMLPEGSFDKTIYPYPPFASDTERLYRQKLAWEKTELPQLDQWDRFSLAHGKPFTIPRWNLTADHTRSEGFDAPYYIQAMFDYIHDPAHNVYFTSYFEFYHYSWLSPTNGYLTNEPKSAAMFRQLFGLASTVTQP
jgi:hypothetical protein